MNTRPGVPEMIEMIEPLMRELIDLRTEVVILRHKTAPPTPTLVELMADTPIMVRQDHDGRWSAGISIGPERGYTGVSGCDTDVAVFKASIRHLADLLERAWTERDDQ